MRRLIGLIAVLALMAGPSAAQDHDGDHGLHTAASTHGMSDSAAAMLEILTERLSLTDEQVTAAMPHVNAMHADAQTAHEVLAQWHADSTSMDAEAVDETLTAAHASMKKHVEAFEALLTDAQRKTFTEMHGDMDRHEMNDHDKAHHEAQHGSDADGGGE